MQRLRQLIHEIHRRSLWRVLGIYVVASGAVLGGVGTLGDVLVLPEWFSPLAFALLIVGLPIVLATAFVQEGGPRRETDDGDVPDPMPVTSARGASSLFTWRNAFGGGVLAFALLGVVGTAWVLLGGGLRSSSIEQSIAVLPFVNMSGNPDNEYFSDGITEELLNALAQLPGVRVPGRTSSFAFKGQNLTIRQIADALDVAHVLEGSVRREGETVLITAKLVDAKTDTHLWSDTYERELDDIFAIQREIATAIADKLQVTLSGDQRETLLAQATESTEAHEAYLRGRYFWNQRTGQSLRTAIAEFQRAIHLDSVYAEAYSGLADSYLLVDIYSLPQNVDFRTNHEQGLSAAGKAVDLAPNIGMAHTSLGFGFFMVGDWARAEQEFERAIELSPGYTYAQMRYSQFLYSTRRADRGVTHAERAFGLDPVDRVMSYDLGQALRLAGRTQDAIAQSRETIRLAPSWGTGWVNLSMSLLEAGAYAEALEAWVQYARLWELDVEAHRDAYQAAIRYHETGEPQRFADFDLTPNDLLFYYAETGQPDLYVDVFDELQVRVGAYGWAAQSHVMWYDPDVLGDNARYQALLEEMRITW